MVESLFERRKSYKILEPRIIISKTKCLSEFVSACLLKHHVLRDQCMYDSNANVHVNFKIKDLKLRKGGISNLIYYVLKQLAMTSNVLEENGVGQLLFLRPAR